LENHVRRTPRLGNRRSFNVRIGISLHRRAAWRHLESTTDYDFVDAGFHCTPPLSMETRKHRQDGHFLRKWLQKGFGLISAI